MRGMEQEAKTYQPSQASGCIPLPREQSPPAKFQWKAMLSPIQT